MIFLSGLSHFLRTALALIAAFVVLDGDTIRAPYGVTYRLTGFDTPETFRAQCEGERILGLAAKVRMEQLVASANVRVEEAGRLDKYGRTLARLWINGEDAATIMIREGYARAYHGGKRKGWC
ncbi:MAG: thermonuclease family protein [Hyphomicrobiales bacterium]|nr:thermonuclease family protein [Hyphomicrobiales bacterium]